MYSNSRNKQAFHGNCMNIHMYIQSVWFSSWVCMLEGAIPHALSAAIQ